MVRRRREKFNAEDVANQLVAKYVTHRTDTLVQWRNLYEFAKDLLERGYMAGRAEERAASTLRPRLGGPIMRRLS